jgi:hypothetical protein
MRLFRVSGVIVAALASSVAANDIQERYNVRLGTDGHTWCGYDLDRYHPTRPLAERVMDLFAIDSRQTVSIDFSSAKVIDVVYTSTSHSLASFDWMVIDHYEPSGDGWSLRRGISLLQQKHQRMLQIVQRTTVHEGKAEPLSVEDIFGLQRGPDGNATEMTEKVDPSTLDLPPVPVITDMAAQPFMKIVFEMRRRSIGKLCKTV